MRQRIAQAIWRIAAVIALAAAGGCCTGAAPANRKPEAPSTQPAVAGLQPPMVIEALWASVTPPVGWRRDKSDIDSRHAHFVWLSSSGDTAYGVVLMNLPLPIGPDFVLWGFLKQMRQTDGQADLLDKKSAPDLPGLRFVAQNGKYRIRVNLTVHEWRAWAVYAGTVSSKPVNPSELQLAEQARDHTRIVTTADGVNSTH